MKPDLELAQRICDYLNDLLEYDRPAIAAMMANRIPCSREMADHPTVQVSVQHGGFHVGLLGVMNGLCGVHDDGYGLISAVFDPPDEKDGEALNQEFYDLVEFKLTKDVAELEENDQ